MHGASGAVGVSVLQQAALVGARVIGTASPASHDVVAGFGGVPVAYGPGLEQRVRELAPEGVVAALDCVGTDEAVEVSLALVADRGRIVTIAAADRARRGGLHPHRRRAARPARPTARRCGPTSWRGPAAGRLVVPVARTFALADALEAAELLMGQHPGGKLVLEP